ncbi:MAG: hypothetical protein KKE44_19240 [Proteobacteria bacterium]|nr:hypothetical protein [Pseudomonadota bacterium]MBU1584869.1 hypothetical protein [Pseudomonadota bacterium]MBU2451883.1 hypothetical protein [Pseudomonadota bacterium]MBU2628757.1 hypothetical protein [Pseudomonadota bacterium]
MTTELKQWEKPRIRIISTIETNETVLVTQSGGPFGSSSSSNDNTHTPAE